MSGAVIDVGLGEQMGGFFQLRERWVVREIDLQRESREDRLESNRGNKLSVVTVN